MAIRLIHRQATYSLRLFGLFFALFAAVFVAVLMVALFATMR
jgi:hypothetical protein